MFGTGIILELPKTWNKMSDKDAYILVQLSPTDAEYVTVSQEFSKTCNRQIVKVGSLVILFSFTGMLINS